MPYLIRDRIHFLSEASKILSSSLDYNVTLAIVAKLVVSSVADFCIIDILENGGMKRLAVRTADPKKQKAANNFFEFLPDPDNKKAIYEAARLARPIIIKKISKSWLRSVSRIDEERKLIEFLSLGSHIFAPLKSRGKVIGVLTIASTDKNFTYSQDDTIFIEELASRIGLAVDNARLYSEAQEAVQTRDEFLSIASHELKTPLTSILLNLQLLLQRIQKSTNKKNDLRDIVKAIETSERQSYRLSKLINDLLNVSLISTGRLQLEKEKMDLVALAKDILLRFEIQLSKAKIKVNLQAPQVLWGRWDKVRLEQVITNLISNAIKYGGHKPIGIRIEKERRMAVLRISDKGIGIKKDVQKTIFERFKRAVHEKDYRGLGVGLYISQQIVKAHGGKLTVESREKKGSTFTVRLPL